MEKLMSEAKKAKSVAVWFEIPAANFERAAGFYETIFATRLRREKFGEKAMGVFPYEQPGISGCVMEAPQLVGPDTGTVVYLNCDGRLDEIAGRVERAGGRLLTPKVDLGE